MAEDGSPHGAHPGEGRRPTELTVRETHLGPVVSEFCFRQPGDPEVALEARAPLRDESRHHPGVFAMMRAKNARSSPQAFGGWRFPSANCVYGDAEGHIGFTTLGAIPVRARDVRRSPTAIWPCRARATPTIGRASCRRTCCRRSSTQAPAFCWSANHRPIGSFYSIPLGTSTGSMGDTIRSWRLREHCRPRSVSAPTTCSMCISTRSTRPGENLCVWGCICATTSPERSRIRP